MAEESMLPEIIKQGGFEITPAPSSLDISTRPDYKKLDAGDAGRIQLSAITSQLPAMMATEMMSNAYFVEFPEGVQGTLLKLKNGGYSTTLVNDKNHFAGSASMYKMTAQTAIVGVFSVMATVSSQYFLKEINKNIRMMRLEIDKILEFLYGDKKAELLSEMSFVRYAYENFSSIMENEVQRIATISSLQESRKVAMKDIEFYTNDLDSLVEQKAGMTLQDILDKAFRIKDSLELSVQLCMVSSLLEVYFSGNYDKNYISYVEKDNVGYIDKLDKHLLGNFAAISQMIQANDAKKIKKEINPKKKDEVIKIVEALKSGEESESRVFLHEALAAPTRSQTFYIKDDGGLYLKDSA